MDYASTTPCDKRVVETMVKYMTDEGEFGNPASRSHSFGWKADDAVDEARKNVAELIGADPKEIVFTSGAIFNHTRMVNTSHHLTSWAIKFSNT